MTRKLGAWCVSLLALAACIESPPAPPKNQCGRAADCAASERCDLERRLCIVEKVKQPYLMAIQVATQRREGGKVRRHTFAPFSLQGSDAELTLSVPSGLTVKGFVGSAEADGMKPVKAQLAFTPLADEPGLPVSAVTATSRSELGADGENVNLTLEPRTRYRLSVFPLGSASTRFPPAQLELDTDGKDRFSFVFPALETLRAIVVDETGIAATGRWVRIIDVATRAVLSSTGVVEGTGEVSLFVYPDVLATGAYRFEVDLDPQNAWETVMEVAPDRLETDKQNTITLPVVPRFVDFRGTVEKSADVRLSSADLTFVSDFPIPDVPGEVGNRDFCRSSLPSDTRSAFVCRSVRRGTTDQEGRFSVDLLPGDYRVFLSPTKDGENVDRATTQPATAVIETQAGDAPQQGQVYMLDTGSRYSAGVRLTNGKPVGNVLVRAVALGVRGYQTEVATYNRSSETLTANDGTFKLAVDLGTYDLVARPAVHSGFPWMYAPNKVVNVQNQTIPIAGFLLPTPVLIAGTLESDGEPEAFANVDAFALLPGEGGRRAVLIGQTTSDAEGRYSLLLSPEILDEDVSGQPADAGSE